MVAAYVVFMCGKNLAWSPHSSFPNSNIGVVLVLYRENGKENGNYYLGFRVRPPEVDRRKLWVYENKIPII